MDDLFKSMEDISEYTSFFLSNSKTTTLP